MKEAPKNIPASVRGRLSNLSREGGEEFGRLLSRFAIERLLYRLSLSPHRDAFLLKGAALFALWPHVPRRSTRDVDLLWIGEGVGESSPARLEEVFRFLCGIAAPEDGLSFEKESVRVTPIRREQRYGGQRVQLEARLDGAHPRSSGRGFWRCCDTGTSRRLLSDIAAFACTTFEGLPHRNRRCRKVASDGRVRRSQHADEGFLRCLGAELPPHLRWSNPKGCSASDLRAPPNPFPGRRASGAARRVLALASQRRAVARFYTQKWPPTGAVAFGGHPRTPRVPLALDTGSQTEPRVGV